MRTEFNFSYFNGFKWYERNCDLTWKMRGVWGSLWYRIGWMFCHLSFLCSNLNSQENFKEFSEISNWRHSIFQTEVTTFRHMQFTTFQTVKDRQKSAQNSINNFTVMFIKRYTIDEYTPCIFENHEVSCSQNIFMRCYIRKVRSEMIRIMNE